MRPNELLGIVERFFLDLIGNVLPGSAFLFGLWIIFREPSISSSLSLFPPIAVGDWLILIICGYVAGFAINSLGERLIVPIADAVVGFLSHWKLTSILVPSTVLSNDQLLLRIQKSPLYEALVGAYTKINPWLGDTQHTDIAVSEWRNLALTLVNEQSYIVHRFMFISLLNLGISTVLITIAILWTVLNVAKDIISSSVIPLNGWGIAILLLTSMLFIERRYAFYQRAIRVPFSMAVVKLGEQTSQFLPQRISALSQIENKQSNVLYLAGGFHSGWQDSVINSLPHFVHLDPRSHGLKNEEQYTQWDLQAIRQSDIVLAYLEATNPAGYALALEIGYAKALGKLIILVDEKSKENGNLKRYLGMVRACSDMTFDSLNDALSYLSELQRIGLT